MNTSCISQMIEEPAWCLTAIALTILFLTAGFWIGRQKSWLIAIPPLILAATGLIAADCWTFSPRERVRAAIEQCVEAVKTNQKEELLKHLAPELASKMETTVNWAFSLAEFTHAYANDVKLEVNAFTTPPCIKATFFAGAKFQIRSGTALMDRYTCVMSVTFEEFEDGEWLISSFEQRSLSQM